MDKGQFGEWLQKERERRGWSQSELARLAGLQRAIIHKTEPGVTMPQLKTFLALAKVLKYSPLFLFRKAGLLPADHRREVRLQDSTVLIEQLSPEDEEELRHTAERKIERRKKERSLSVRKPRVTG